MFTLWTKLTLTLPAAVPHACAALTLVQPLELLLSSLPDALVVARFLTTLRHPGYSVPFYSLRDFLCALPLSPLGTLSRHHSHSPPS